MAKKASQPIVINKLTFNQVSAYWDRIGLITIRVMTKGGTVSRFEPTVDPLPDEIARWQKTFDDAAFFKVGDGVWISREQFQLILDAEGV